MRTDQVALGAFLSAGALLCTFSAAHAEDFYKGKTLNIVVGYSPGGGYDTNARVLARHIGKHIPGNPTVVVVNMPGAGSLRSVEHLDHVAAKDGTFINAFDFTLIANSRMTPDKVRSDFRKFAWIGSVAQDLAACYVWHTVAAKNLDELRRVGKVYMGRTNPGSASDTEQKIIKGIFKVDVHHVAGYAGSAEAMLAVERGELNAGCLTWSSLPAEWIQNGKIRPVLRFGTATAPDLPASIPEAAAIAPSERERQIIRVLMAAGELGKPFIASREVPADRVRILRDAFSTTMKDPQFLADAEKLRLPVTPKTADEAGKIVEEVYATPDDVVAAAKDITSE